MEHFFVPASPEHVKKQKALARELRKTPWWDQQISKGICHYCEGQFPKVEMTMDHKIPVIRGGQSTKSNVVPSCKTCNSDKKYLTDVEYLSAK